MSGAKENQDTYSRAFEQIRKERTAPSWLGAIQESAMQRFIEMGFPTTRDEAWRFTNVSPIRRVRFEPARFEQNTVSLDRLAGVCFADVPFTGQSYRLVFVNGFFAEELSSLQRLPEGITAGSLRAAIEREAEPEARLARYAEYQSHSFVALNTALTSDGAFVRIGDGVVLDNPIWLIFASTNSHQPHMSHPRNLIVAGKESQASVIECFVGLDDGVYFTNAVTELVAGENAFLDHYKLQVEGAGAFHVATVQALQERDSRLRSCSVSLGAALARNDINSVLAGPGAECAMNGLYFVAGSQHVDHHTLIDHATAHCTSRELYKGILDGQSSAVFSGSIIVRKDAQKSDARQSNKNLLLSDDAIINSKPELEIYADDVKCTHGTTIGQIERDALFYLRSRGIEEQEARSLLTYAFASEVLDAFAGLPARKKIEDELFARISNGVMEVA